MFHVACQPWLVATSPENFRRCLEVEQSTLSGEWCQGWRDDVEWPGTTWPLAWYVEVDGGVPRWRVAGTCSVL